MIITAKFSSICPTCRTSIAVGAKVEWSKGSKAQHVACASVAGRAPSRPEPVALDGSTAKMGQHWSSRGRGPVERLCAGGCGRRVGPRYAECYSCNRESMDAM